MLREGWNFKNDIAGRLEHRVCNLYGHSDRPSGTIFDSDLIEMKTFAECMILAIRKMYDYTCDNEEVNTFVENVVLILEYQEMIFCRKKPRLSMMNLKNC